MKRQKYTSFLIAVVFTILSCQKNTQIFSTENTLLSSRNISKFEIDLSQPIWHDEFDYQGKPNPKLWSYDIGGHGWGNQELQYYTDDIENCKVENGHLIISALKQEKGQNKFTSTRLVSKNKGDITYGRIEVKAQLPKGIGTWPAIWMLASKNSYGNQYWPDNGEIDIMEHVGFDQNTVHGNVHTKAFNHSIGTNKGNKITVPNASEKMNIYAINWYPDKIEFEINGNKYFEFEKKNGYSWQEWPFDKPFHIILNIAVGGTWGGQRGLDESVFPQSMVVDYVRFYGLKK